MVQAEDGSLGEVVYASQNISYSIPITTLSPHFPPRLTLSFSQNAPLMHRWESRHPLQHDVRKVHIPCLTEETSETQKVKCLSEHFMA